MPLSGDAGEGGSARGAETWADTLGSSGERRHLLQLPHSMDLEGPGSVSEDGSTGTQLAPSPRPVRGPERRNLAAP